MFSNTEYYNQFILKPGPVHMTNTTSQTAENQAVVRIGMILQA